MKRLKKVLSVMLVICFVFQAVCIGTFAKEGTANVPYDIYGHWGQDYIYSLIDSGIIKGYEDQTFRPNNSITRAEFCTLVIETLVNRKGIEYSEIRGTFKDVTDKDWYAKYVETAVELGIVGGVGDGYFDPNGKMNREQLAKMMSDVYCLEKEVSFEEIASPEDSYKDFEDSKDMSDWAFKYISAAYNAGLMQGKENGFEPKAPTTRAEAATIIYRLFGFTKVDIPNNLHTLDTIIKYICDEELTPSTFPKTEKIGQDETGEYIRLLFAKTYLEPDGNGGIISNTKFEQGYNYGCFKSDYILKIKYIDDVAYVTGIKVYTKFDSVQYESTPVETYYNILHNLISDLISHETFVNDLLPKFDYQKFFNDSGFVNASESKCFINNINFGLSYEKISDNIILDINFIK